MDQESRDSGEYGVNMELESRLVEFVHTDRGAKVLSFAGPSEASGDRPEDGGDWEQSCGSSQCMAGLKKGFLVLRGSMKSKNLRNLGAIGLDRFLIEGLRGV